MGGAKLDENVRFLYICVKNSRGNDQIDWPAVATAMGINVSTARMRFRRLEDKIQGATNKTSGADKDVKMAGTPDGDGPVELPKEPEKKKTRLTKRKRTGKGAEDD